MRSKSLWLLLAATLLIVACTNSPQQSSLQEAKPGAQDLPEQSRSHLEETVVDGAPQAPRDEVQATITVLSGRDIELQNLPRNIHDSDLKILARIDGIKEYLRYPYASNPLLRTGEQASIQLAGFRYRYDQDDKDCPEGYVLVSNGAESDDATQDSVLQVEAMRQYDILLHGCFEDTCAIEKTWVGYLYHPDSIQRPSRCALATGNAENVPDDT